MLQLNQVRLECGRGKQALEAKITRLLRLNAAEHYEYHILRHSVDCRKKPLLFDVYTVSVQLPPEREKALLAKHIPGLTSFEPKTYVFPHPGIIKLTGRPVIVGFGPAGIFCGYFLAKHGFRPLILERGRAIPERTADVEAFWKTNRLDTGSNIQFGEGGAGTFSDGKLNTLAKDREGRNDEVLRVFASAGAPDEILTEAKPHIGTDCLRDVIVNLRHEIEEAGGEVRFDACVESLLIREGHVTGVRMRDGTAIPADVVVLAPGHSARDTFETLLSQNVPMEQKDFAVGFRVAHPQSLIDHQQYGISDRQEMQRLGLVPASYKLTASVSSGRGVYSFCMCPGGYVVNASSEEGRLAVNGMSYRDRGSAQADSAIVMTVSAKDFGGTQPLDGMKFQRGLEEKCYHIGNGCIPVENFEDFEACFADAPKGQAPAARQLPKLCIMGQYGPGALHSLLPAGMTADFLEGMHAFDRTIRGFAGPQCWVIGLESRTSSPVRIVRDSMFQSGIRGLYPCGEGAGYAGGIMSAATDGIRVAEAVAAQYTG